MDQRWKKRPAVVEGERISRFRKCKPGRLDIFLVDQMPEFTRSRLQGLISEGRVKVDGEVASKAGMKLKGHEEILILVPPPISTELIAEEIPLDVVFENADVLIVNKPAGMVVHPSVGHDSGTLVHAALAHIPDLSGVGGELRPGVVHRLDKDTSGLIVLAKNDQALQHLQVQFQERNVKKTYIALVDGEPPTPEGKVDAPIGRDSRQRQRMAVTSPAKGRQAVSEYKTVEKFARHSLLEVHPVSGRTHQIRVHMAFLGCPVAGDKVYGFKRPSIALKRHFLHAHKLQISLPGEAQLREFEAELPIELASALNELRR